MEAVKKGEAGTWGFWIASTPPKNAVQFGFANTYYGQAIFEDPKWDYHDFNFDKDVAYGDEKVGPSSMQRTRISAHSGRAAAS